MTNKNFLKDTLSLTSQVENPKNISVPCQKGILYEKFKDDFGNDILHKIGENTVTIGGAVASLENLTGIPATWKPKTLNEIYSINESIPHGNLSGKICLFGVGVGGCSLSIGGVVPKDVKNNNVPELIPLRSTDIITDADAGKYFLKKSNDDGTYRYYLKELAMPNIKTCWKDSADEEVDGTEVTEEIDGSSRTEGLQTFADFTIDINMRDIREYFESIGSIDSARYNSIGLFTGDKVQLEDGSFDYVNVRLFSYLNIDNKSVKIKTASQYIYRILSLV